jgi:pimeloyl-ACP methyl ester carboxylesterase
MTVRFRVYEHTDTSAPGLEPLVGFEGGPGYPSIGSAYAYRFLLGKLHRRHDLIVMDNRGTGSSGAIACPALQRGLGNYVDAVAACARKLGPVANAYGTAAVADDLHAILRGLGVTTVDVYGDSYGSYAAEVFTIRYPGQVRAAIFDGTYDNGFSPFETEASATLRTSWVRLCRRAGACPDILGAIGRFDRRLAVHPLRGQGRDADGNVVHVDLTARAFAQLVADATYSDTVFRDLPAAMRSLRGGDAAPMLRLAAEDASSNAAGGSPSGYSAGDYMAVSCHDYPTAWDPSADLATRRAQLAAATAALPRDVFAPFPFKVWLGSLYESELVRGCLKWPAPTVPDPPFPRGSRPNVPVLVLGGEFDQATPPADAKAVARAFPDSTFVEVRNAGHVTATWDYQGCASGIARHFLRMLSAGDTSCASRMPDVNVVPVFPTVLAQAPVTAAVGPGDHSTPTDRRAAWVASQTIGDALVRWYNLMYGTSGVGLRGGSFSVHGPYLSRTPLSLVFRGTRFVQDLMVSGTAVWDRTTYGVAAWLRVRGPGGLSGTLRIAFPTDRAHPVATVRGTLSGRQIDVRPPVPWSP